MFRKGLMLKEIFLKNSSGTELKINLWENAIQLMDNVITYATKSGVGCWLSYLLEAIMINTSLIQQAQPNSISTFKERNISVLQALSSVECNMKDRSLRNRKTLSQILQMLNADSVSCTKIGCRKKVIAKGDHYWCNNCNNAIPSLDARYQLKVRIQDDTESTLITIFGDEAEKLLKHPASELARLIESADGIQTVKAIMDEIIGTSIVFEIKINQYNIQSQGRDGFTANKVTESSHILNDSFQAQLPDNMKQNNSTLMKEKQILLASSNDIPQPSNKKKRSNQTFKRKAYMEFSTGDSNETSRTSVIRPPSKRVRRIKENKSSRETNASTTRKGRPECRRQTIIFTLVVMGSTSKRLSHLMLKGTSKKQKWILLCSYYVGPTDSR
ncbi:hypothetical protein IFM89_032184 [Coptis chinensis]|uniref:Replication factor A C-terminal domain-containing protein n=1 Tax=Coptis chinensis TaxID=261450 RepID=A0A835MBC9_9MAGN|nr:hypothetical protein IFM89_032184 [Coptis chinensis]